jgi:hypothetical protein
VRHLDPIQAPPELNELR